MSTASWVRFVSSAIFWCATIFAAISMSTMFQRDALIAAAIALVAGAVWLGCLIREESIRQRTIVGTLTRQPVPVPVDDIEFDEELPWVTGEDHRPHWDTNVMGAPE